MHGEGGGSALTSSVPGLGLQSSLKRTTAEQSEEARLQEAEALAEVTAQEKGDDHRLWEGTSGRSPSLHLMTPSPGVILQTTLSVLRGHPTCTEAGDIPGPAFRGPCLQSRSLTPVGT